LTYCFDSTQLKKKRLNQDRLNLTLEKTSQILKQPPTWKIQTLRSKIRRDEIYCKGLYRSRNKL